MVLISFLSRIKQEYSFFVTNKVEALLEISCCSVCCLFFIDVFVSVFLFTIDDDDDNDDGKDVFDRFCLKTHSTIPFGWLIKLGRITIPKGFLVTDTAELSNCDKDNFDQFCLKICNTISFGWPKKNAVGASHYSYCFFQEGIVSVATRGSGSGGKLLLLKLLSTMFSEL